MSFLEEARKRQEQRNTQLNNNTESTSGSTRIEEARKRVAEAQNQRLNEIAIQLPMQTTQALQNIRQNVQAKQQALEETPEQKLINMGIPADQVYQYSSSMRDTANTIQDYSMYGSNAKRVKEQVEQAEGMFTGVYNTVGSLGYGLGSAVSSPVAKGILALREMAIGNTHNLAGVDWDKINRQVDTANRNIIAQYGNQNLLVSAGQTFGDIALASTGTSFLKGLGATSRVASALSYAGVSGLRAIGEEDNLKDVAIETAKGGLYGVFANGINNILAGKALKSYGQKTVLQKLAEFGKSFINNSIAYGTASAGTQILDVFKDDPNYDYINWNEVEEGIKSGKYKDINDFLNSQDYTNMIIKNRGSQIVLASLIGGMIGALGETARTNNITTKDNEALKTLGLKAGATKEEIKKAYYKLAKIYHPDIAGTGDAKRFTEINNAYNSLINKGAYQNIRNTGTQPSTATQPSTTSPVTTSTPVQPTRPITVTPINPTPVQPTQPLQNAPHETMQDTSNKVLSDKKMGKTTKTETTSNMSIDEMFNLLKADEIQSYKYEDKSLITESVNELEAKKEEIRKKYPDKMPDDVEDIYYEIKIKLEALKKGYKNQYDYWIGEAKKRFTEEYNYDPQKYNKEIEKIKKQEEKAKQLEQEIKEAPQHKRLQYEIIQESNPMFDDEHVGIRSPADIKTWEEAMQDKESFTWGDFSYKDAQNALEKGKVRVYSSYPIKNGVFVSTSYEQALEYAGMDKSKVHSKEVALDSVAWINGDEGQYAKVKNKPTESKDVLYDKKPTKTVETKEEKKTSPTSRETIINTIKEKTGIKEFSNTKKGLMEIASKIRNVIKDDSYTTNDIKNIVDETLKEIKVAENADYYEQYKDLKKNMRKTKLYVSDSTKKAISNWSEFRKKAMGTLILTNDKDSLTIDRFYDELSSEYGEDMFPSDIVNPADQLQKIYDVSKSIKKNYVSLEDYIKNEEGEEGLLVAKSEIIKGIKEIAKVFDKQRDIDTSKRAIEVDEDTRNVLKTLGFTDEDINDPANAYVQNIAENVFKNKDYFNKPLREIEKEYLMTGDRATNYIIEKRRFDINNGLVERNENYMKGASRDSMRKAIEEFTGKKIGLKGFRQKAYGIYKTKFDSIRVKNINNIETIVHELGHKIEATELEKLPMEAEDELLDLAERGFGDAYDDDIATKISEGWAEFVRRFVVNNLETIEEYPQLSMAFMREMTANMRLGQFIENLVQKVEEYVNSDSETVIQNSISVGEETDKEGKKSLIDRYMYAMHDDLWYVKQYQKEMAELLGMKYYELKPENAPYTLQRLSKVNGDMVKNAMEKGLRDSESVKRTKGFSEIFETLKDPKDIQKVRALLIAERTIDYLGSNYESGISIQDAFNIIKKYGKDPVISKVANEIIDYSNELLNIMADEGLIAKEDVEELRKWNQKYVPLKRVFEEQKTKGLSKTSEKLYSKRTGSLRTIIDPLESIIENTSLYLNKRNFNNVMLSYYNLMNLTENTNYVEEVDPAMVVKSQMSLKAFKKALEEQGVDTDELDLDVVARTFAPQFSDDKNMIIGFMKDGKQKALQFKDRDLYNAVMSNNVAFRGLSDALIAFERATGILRLGATTGNINFALPNMVSDTFTAWLFSENNFVPVVDTLRGAFDYLVAEYGWDIGNKSYLGENNFLYDLYKQSGATMSSRIGSYRVDKQNYVKEIFGKHATDLFSDDRTKVQKAVTGILKGLQNAPRKSRRRIKFLT